MRPLPISAPVPEFKGLSVLPQAQAGAADAMQPAAQAYSALEGEKQGIEAIDEKRAKAQQFQSLLSKGLEGMNAYVSEVAQKHPDLGQQFATEMQGFAPLFQDPNITGDKARELTTWAYDSWDKRLQEREKKAKELTPEQKQAQEIETYRKKKEIDSEFKPGKGETESDRARRVKKERGLKAIPGILSELMAMGKFPQTKPIDDATGDPEKTGAENTKIQGDFSTRATALKDKLRTAEADAGLPMTKFPLNRIEDSPSFKLYQATLSGGGSPSPGGSLDSSQAPVPKAGQVVDGYRFKGGDPGDEKNWEEAK